MNPISDLHPTVRRFVEDAGNLTQSFGFGRVVGQLYAYLYFSAEPRGLADMKEALAISKGSASTAVRQLEQWGAVKKVWVKGDRRDYYEAVDWFGRILKNVVTETVTKKMAAYSTLLDEIDADMAEIPEGENGEGKFIRARIKHLHKFQKRAGGLWSSPLLQKLLK